MHLCGLVQRIPGRKPSPLSVACVSQVIALTFDDGPTNTTAAVLSVLKEFGAKVLLCSRSFPVESQRSPACFLAQARFAPRAPLARQTLTFTGPALSRWYPPYLGHLLQHRPQRGPFHRSASNSRGPHTRDPHL